MRKFVRLICLVFSHILVAHMSAAQTDYTFEHLRVEDGLSQSTVFTIYKDQKDILWFGTRRGLNMYDGYQIRHLLHNPSDSNSLHDNTIINVIGDSKDNLIIQTRSGINYYDRYNEKFYLIQGENRFFDYAKDWNNQIWACSGDGLFYFQEETRSFEKVTDRLLVRLFRLSVDNKNNIWATTGEGVVRYNMESRQTELFPINDDIAPSKRYFYIGQNSDGKTWVCSRDGALYYFDEEDRSFKHHTSYKESLIVTNLSRGLEGNMLIATDGMGLIQLSRDGSLTQFNHEPDVKGSLSSNTIYSVYADDQLGMIWLGSYMGGVNYTFRQKRAFGFIYHAQYNEESIINNNIRSLLIDSEGKVWLGTRQGISVLDSLDNLLHQFDSELLLKNGIENPVITKIYEDPSGYIWICSYKGGIILYDKVRRVFKKVKEVYPGISLPGEPGVFDVLMDSRNNLWVASEEGTYLYPHNKEGFVFDDRFSKDILQDRAGRIFIGTSYNGLFFVNDQTLQMMPVVVDSAQSFNTIRRINTLYESDGILWVGTGGGGIYKYDPTNAAVSHYGSSDGLPDDNVAGITRDPNGHFWVTTYTGICRYSKASGRFKLIHLEKNTKGKEFNPGSIAMSGGGTLYGGSVNGLLTLNTESHREDPYLPKVVFTELYVNNKLVKAGEGPTEKSIMFSKEIELDHDQSTIRLNFTAPAYYLGDKVSFSYKIASQSEDWIDLGDDRSLHFMDLKPGKYLLSVKAANSDGHSSDQGTELLIRVLPPFWRTLPAYLGYLAIGILILLLIRRMVKARIKLKYQVFSEQTERQKQEEINQSRVRLFTDVSHEIGTSLTLINVPLETLLNIESDELKRHQLAIINSNVNRLKQLVKRILGLRKVETGNMPLLAERDDLSAFIDVICQNYEPLVKRNRVNFIKDIPGDELITWFDKEKLEYIVYNLLSNAFKFEPENGTVFLSLTRENRNLNGRQGKCLCINVRNENSVIPQDKAEEIFNRFSVLDQRAMGAGIGLNLIKSYVNIHKGEINLHTGEERGVEFEVILPFGSSYLEENEKLETNSNYVMKTPEYLQSEPEGEYELVEGLEHKEVGKILVVEDNVDLKKLLKEQLVGKYEIITAGDGEEALLKAKSQTPDLILTDWVMPTMDGIELCKAVKEDLDIGHIPVVLLTAKDDMEDRIMAMEAGADAFIQKPFQMNYLSSVILNLIELRRKLRKRYHTNEDFEEQGELKSIDEIFLEKTYRVMEENLTNTQFGVPLFAEKLGVSKYMLYTKIKDLTGLTPNDFLVVFKLKKAAHVLKNKKISDVEVYHKVGFNDVSYFRKCFKKHFGMTPNQFVKSNRMMDSSS